MLEFLAQNSLYVVLLILLIVWIGIFAYLARIDAKLKRLERQADRSSG